MVTADIIAMMRSKVADELSFDQENRNRIAVHTPFMYQDGDHCSFLAVRSATGNWHLTDEGEVISHAGYSGIDLLAEDRISRFHETTDFYGLRESRRELLLPVENDDFGSAFFTFSQACLDLVQLAKLPPEKKERKTSDFRAVVRDLIGSVISASSIEERWYDPNLDPDRVYPVDMRIRGKERPLYVYGITNEMHCLISAVSYLHHATRGAKFTGVAIFNDAEAISRRSRLPLIESADVTFPSMSCADEIRAFFSAQAV